MSKKINKWIIISLFWLVVIAVIGALLRFMFISSFNYFSFQNLLHSHSHVAMLGWLYSILIVSIINSYVNLSKVSFKKYSINFWVTQISVFGMLIAFTVQGYAVFSIAFSALHIFLFYWFVWMFIRDISKNQELVIKHSVSLIFIKASLLFFFLSTLSPYVLTIITLKGFANSDYYKMLIYFYLHFQYNGWLTFVMIGLFLFLLKSNLQLSNHKQFKIGFWILFITAFPSYFFSFSFYNNGNIISILLFATALFQLYAAKLLIGGILKYRKELLSKTSFTLRLLFYLSIIALFLKFTFQFILTLPHIGNVAFIIREIPIGFLHLIMLGFLSCGIIYWLAVKRLITSDNLLFKYGVYLFILGLIFSEILLFSTAFIFWFQFYLFPNINDLLFASSVLMAIGIILVFISQFIKIKPVDSTFA